MRIALSENFYLDEFCRSQMAARHGMVITVAPGSAEFYSLTQLCRTVLQPLREALGPVYIDSGYRPKMVNLLVGGSRHSSHMLGCAADIVVSGHPPLAVCRWIAAHLPSAFDQLINEFGQWTHVSVARGGALPRGELMTAWREPVASSRPQEPRTRTACVSGLHEISWLGERARPV